MERLRIIPAAEGDHLYLSHGVGRCIEPVAFFQVLEGEHGGLVLRLHRHFRARNLRLASVPSGRAPSPLLRSMKKTALLLALLALSLGARATGQRREAGLARETISAMQADKMFNNMSAQMKQMSARMIQLPPDATPEARQKAEELQGKIMDLTMVEAKALIEKLDGIYASVYTEGELKTMLSFFKSAEGQSMLAKQPQVMAQLMPLVQQMQQSLMPKIQKLIEEARGPAALSLPGSGPVPIPGPTSGPAPMPAPAAK